MFYIALCQIAIWINSPPDGSQIHLSYVYLVIYNNPSRQCRAYGRPFNAHVRTCFTIHSCTSIWHKYDILFHTSMTSYFIHPYIQICISLDIYLLAWYSLNFWIFKFVSLWTLYWYPNPDVNMLYTTSGAYDNHFL